VSQPGRVRSRRRTLARRAFLFAVPVATAIVIAGHPPDPETATDLGERTGRYVAVHVGLLFMLPLLGVALWLLLDGVSGLAATVSRAAIPVTLVFYAAFDALDRHRRRGPGDPAAAPGRLGARDGSVDRRSARGRACPLPRRLVPDRRRRAGAGGAALRLRPPALHGRDRHGRPARGGHRDRAAAACALRRRAFAVAPRAACHTLDTPAGRTDRLGGHGTMGACPPCASGEPASSPGSARSSCSCSPSGWSSTRSSSAVGTAGVGRRIEGGARPETEA
jgi:hypothetical protein